MAVKREVMDGYIRVSAVGGRTGERFQSPAEQRNAITGWAKAHGVRIGKIHEDLDRSGGTMDRPGMKAAIERIETGKSGGIIVAKLDRFARTVIGGLTTIQQLHERGARVVSVAESLDPATPIGRAMLGLLLIMAEWQRDQADEAIGAAMTRANAAGRYVIRTPYGYARDQDGQVVPDDETAPVVRRVFQRRAEGAGWRLIANELTDAGIPAPTGGAWSHNTIFGLVRSESPLGHFSGPRGHAVKDAWPPLVSRDLWEAANAIHGVRDNDRRHHDRLLAGIARCAECRSTLKRAVNPQGYVSYACLRIGCQLRPSIGAAILDEHVAALLAERVATIRLEHSPGDDPRLAQLVAASEATSREFEAWRDDTTMRQVIGDSDYRAGLMERAKARDAADMALADHRANNRLRVIRQTPASIEAAFGDLEWEDQRLVADAYLHSVWVRKSTVRGPAARRHVGERVRVVWMDDRDQPALPAPTVGRLAPVDW